MRRCAKGICAILSLSLFLTLTACGGQQNELPDLSGLGEIAVVAREEGSGTRAEFESLTDSNGGGIDQLALSTQEVVEQVAADENAVGYLALSAGADGDVKLLSIDGVAPEESAIQSGKYPLCRSYYLAYIGELNEAESDFMAYLLSAGQEIVAQSCVPVNKTSSFLSNGSAGTITISGSSSMEPLMEQLAEDYRSYNPNVTIRITASDSTDGLTSAIRGTCDFAMSSRSLKDYEAELLEYRAIANDGVAVAVNPVNPLENLTLEQLRGIYDGAFVQWTELK